MIQYDSLTMNILFLVAGLLITYDIYTVIERGSETTISMQLLNFSKKYPIVAFLLGVIFGHIFWPLS